LKLTVKLTIQNRKATASVVPAAATLVIKALKEPLRDRKKVKHVLHDGDISFQDVWDVAKIMRVRSMARNMAGTCKEILGTAQSVGCTVEGKHPHEIIDEIDDGSREVEDYEAPAAATIWPCRCFEALPPAYFAASLKRFSFVASALPQPGCRQRAM